jgi:hypothetical protein
MILEAARGQGCQGTGLPGDLADRKAKDITLVRLCPSMTVRTVQLENMLRKQGFRAL